MLVPGSAHFLHVTPLTRHVHLTHTLDKGLQGYPIPYHGSISALLHLAQCLALPNKQFIEISISVSWSEYSSVNHHGGKQNLSNHHPCEQRTSQPTLTHCIYTALCILVPVLPTTACMHTHIMHSSPPTHMYTHSPTCPLNTTHTPLTSTLFPPCLCSLPLLSLSLSFLSPSLSLYLYLLTPSGTPAPVLGGTSLRLPPGSLISVKFPFVLCEGG